MGFAETSLAALVRQWHQVSRPTRGLLGSRPVGDPGIQDGLVLCAAWLAVRSEAYLFIMNEKQM